MAKRIRALKGWYLLTDGGFPGIAISEPQATEGRFAYVSPGQNHIRWYDTEDQALASPAYQARAADLERQRLEVDAEAAKTPQEYAGKEADARRWLKDTGQAWDADEFPWLALEVNIGKDPTDAANEIMTAVNAALAVASQRIQNREASRS